MPTLILWHNRFSENENEAVEAHIPRHRDSKTKEPQHRDSKAKKPRHKETETINPWHRGSKTFFQWTKIHDVEIPRPENHDIEIPRPRSHGIEFPRNSDPYAPWYEQVVVVTKPWLGAVRRSCGCVGKSHADLWPVWFSRYN